MSPSPSPTESDAETSTGEKSEKNPYSSIDEATLLDVLKRRFGHNGFRSAHQRAAITCLLTGKHDVFVSMPTGSGKSLIFQLPGVLAERKVTIVVSVFKIDISKCFYFSKNVICSREMRDVTL